ncbi:MAG: GNAT family N-acetyltransferase, partial [Beijerinckiaceae bacterium]
DTEQLIDLMVVSSWGGIRGAWERARAHGETWRDRGRIEIADRDSEIGDSRFVVAETGGRIAAMVLLNLVGDTRLIEIGRAVPEEAAALRLIKQASFSVFIREIATADWARGRGLAGELLGLAERVAVSNGTARLTLIVNDANRAAERMYVGRGFAVCGEEACIGHPHFPEGSRLLLMEKSLSAASDKKEGAPESAP